MYTTNLPKFTMSEKVFFHAAKCTINPNPSLNEKWNYMDPWQKVINPGEKVEKKSEDMLESEKMLESELKADENQEEELIVKKKIQFTYSKVATTGSKGTVSVISSDLPFKKSPVQIHNSTF